MARRARGAAAIALIVLLALPVACPQAFAGLAADALRVVFACHVTITPTGGVATTTTTGTEGFVEVGSRESVTALERTAEGVGGAECASIAVGAAAAAVAGWVYGAKIFTPGDVAETGLAWGECPAAVMRALLEAEVDNGRSWGNGCEHYGRFEGESVAVCVLRRTHPVLFPPGSLSLLGFEPTEGGQGEGRWALSDGPADAVIVCSVFSASTRLADIEEFVVHHVERLRASHVFFYDVGPAAARANVSGAAAAVPARLLPHVTFARLPNATGSEADAVSAFRACAFSYGLRPRWALFAEPHERVAPGAAAATLPALVALPRFARYDAVMLRMCGRCGAELRASDCCGQGRPLLLFGRSAVAGVWSACTGYAEGVASAHGTPAPVNLVACGDTPGMPGHSECGGCRDVPHVCAVEEGAASDARVGPAWGPAPCAARAETVVPRVPRPSRELVPEVPLRRAWASRPASRALRVAYATMVFGEPSARSLALLSFMLASLRAAGTQADIIVLVPDVGVWRSHAGMAAALRGAGARLWEVPVVEPPERCRAAVEADRRAAYEAPVSRARPPGYFSPTYIQSHVIGLAAYDAVVYMDAFDVAVNMHVDMELASFAAGDAQWAGRADKAPACRPPSDGVFEVRGLSFSSAAAVPASCCGPQVNSGILFVRPSRALHAHVQGENRGNPRIGCMRAVQDLLNSVLWGAFGVRGFECMPASLHCVVMLLEDCRCACVSTCIRVCGVCISEYAARLRSPRVAKLTQYAGHAKPWLDRVAVETLTAVARAAEFNARLADWEAGTLNRKPAPLAWPNERWSTALVDIDEDTLAVFAAGGHRMFLFDPASAILARSVAAGVGESAPIFVNATPAAATEWARQHGGGNHRVVLVASAARLEAFCSGFVRESWGLRPVIWLPQDAPVGKVAALAAALAPCASELWAHPFTAGAAGCGDRNNCRCPVVRSVPLAVAVDLAAAIRTATPGSSVEYVLLTANAVSRPACTAFSRHVGDEHGVACFDVGHVMSGRVPTSDDVAAMVAGARAVVVSYDAVPRAGGTGPLAPPPHPTVLALAAGGRRVVAWCLTSLVRLDGLCAIDVPGSIVSVVESVEAAVAEAARIAGSPGDAEAVAMAAFAWWPRRPV